MMYYMYALDLLFDEQKIQVGAKIFQNKTNTI